jgi:hypothetical protein
LVQFGLALTLFAAAVGLAMVWRLSQGPLDLPWLAARLEQAFNADQNGHLAIGSAALAWEGFSAGVERPIDIRLNDIVVTDAAGQRIATVPRAEVSLAAGWLILGKIVPSAVEIDDARLVVMRDANGGISLDAPDASRTDPSSHAGTDAPQAPAAFSAGMLRDLLLAPAAHANAKAFGRASLLRHAHIINSNVTVIDRQIGLTWTLAGLDIDLRRVSAGGLVGRAASMLQVERQDLTTLRLSAQVDLVSGSGSVAVHVARIVPAALARTLPEAAALASLDSPLLLDATMEFGPELAPGPVRAHAELGAGAWHAGEADVAIFGASMDVVVSSTHATVKLEHLDFAPRNVSRHTIVHGQAELDRPSSGEVIGTGSIDLDQVAFADLHMLWPKGLGGPGARAWVTENITNGIASHGHMDVGARIRPDFSDASLTRLQGSIDGTDLTVRWLHTVPPIEHAAAKLTLSGIDGLAIAVTGGRQAGGGQGGVNIDDGRVTISGLSAPDQFADIDADVSGPVSDLIALLREPGLRLLERSPISIKGASGLLQGKILVANLPLRGNITIDDVAIRAHAKASDLRLDGVAAGRNLSDGDATFDVTNDGLNAIASANIAGIPAQLRLGLDFRAGPKTQVMQNISLMANLDAHHLADLGLDLQDYLSGSVALNVELEVQRDGQGWAQINGDLGSAGLNLAALGLAKPAGRPANLSARVLLSDNAVIAIRPLHLAADGIRLDASASFASGKLESVNLEKLLIGTNTDISGTVLAPKSSGPAWRIAVKGTSLDLAAQFQRAQAPGQPAPRPDAVGPPYVVDANLGRVVLGKDRAVEMVVAHVENDGQVTRLASLTGRTRTTNGDSLPGSGTFALSITPSGNSRKLSVSAKDAGGLLMALDVDDKIAGGKLAISGTYDDARQGNPLNGSATIDDFRVHDAPMLGKLLQAMTLYGLADIARGPGLGFSRLVAPFKYSAEKLELADARAFSASLGMTAKGEIDLSRHAANLQGTIVPAYFFNALLGSIPLFGRLFSPEKGGGVFAATYAVRGPLDDPTVTVNPLATLTPGFLRGVFGPFDWLPTENPQSAHKTH